ncbi:MAG: hypothetical protein K2N90_02040 [Lachnospiraceae bacterium]|nr:hypothetical protein [Lachnospiraceae bacterium]
MEYDYVICPKCWDKLIEVEKKEDLALYMQRKCSKCGTHFGLALHGNKIEDSIYQIILTYKMELDDQRITGMRNGLKNVHLDADSVMRAIDVGEQGDIIYEGDSLHTYLLAKVLSGYGPWILFEIVPEFPYEIYEPDMLLCPKCGADVIGRTEPYNDIKGWFLDGLFCEHCNTWTLGPTAKRDTTVYRLRFFYTKLRKMEDCSLKRGIMNRLDKIPDKKIQGDQMTVHTNSEKILEMVPYLRSMDFAYEIEPSFPHRIG